MSIVDYFQRYSLQIEIFARTGIFADENLEFDHRTETIGVIRGRIIFCDGSLLSLMEFVDTQIVDSRLTYSYHYQSAEGTPIFRYDNAPHRPVLGYQHHRHSGTEIKQSDGPSIHDILIEVASRFV